MEPKFQNVVLTFSDGTVAIFTGPVACIENDTRTIADIRFTIPTDLPGDCSWE